ncbi:tyrosine-protein phosphatase [Siminovitchia sediminis]|uniref:Tyrosine-protein phosphatase n=1 Tax=Siminovitchia sediminis TaxID=1274353 RepID=A0ABW4KK83_9BACI
MDDIILNISTCALNFRLPHGMDYSRHIYRSGNFNQLNKSSLSLLREKIGITHLYDLRTHQEYKNDNIEELCSWYDLKLVSLPLGNFPSRFRTKKILLPEDYVQYYEQILAYNQSELYILFTELLYHLNFRNFVFGCHAGKDRTGIVSYLLLSMAGKSIDDKVKDYVLSSYYINQKLDFFKKSWQKRGLTPLEYAKRIEAIPTTIKLFDRSIKSIYGGVENYFNTIGFNWREITGIKKSLE